MSPINKDNFHLLVRSPNLYRNSYGFLPSLFNLFFFLHPQYHFYEKNPYAFALEHIHGDLPLVYVDFARRGARARDFSVARSKAVKTSRFIRPADIILDFPSMFKREDSKRIILIDFKDQSLECRFTFPHG